MSDALTKYFCPRLLDYVVIIGARKINPTQSVQSPELVRCYPREYHQDFPLPRDMVFFCQPEGCVSVGPKKISLRESNSFVFALTEKDTSKIRYGICVNFFRRIEREQPVEKLYQKETQRSFGTEQDFSSYQDGGSDSAFSDQASGTTTNLNDSDMEQQNFYRQSQRKKRLRTHSLTSLCIISHHPFFSTFRECLFVLKRLIDSANDHLGFGQGGLYQSQRESVWSVLIGKINENTSPIILQHVREIETWIFRLLSAPVPVPSKTKVEVEVLPKDLHPPLIFALPDHTRFSLVDFPLHLPLELLGIETCMQVLTCLLLENKLVLQSRDYNALSMSVMAFVNIIYPLEYMFPIIPLLPTCMIGAEQLLLAPTPYIIGVPASFLLFKQHFRLPDDVWLIDLDSNKITKPPDSEELPPLPEPEGTILQNHIKQALASMSMLPHPVKTLSKADPAEANSTISTDYNVTMPSTGFNPLIFGNDVDTVDIATRVAMVRFFNSPNLLAHFAEHTRTLRLYPRPVVALQINSLLQSRPKVSTFLKKFVRTQAVEFMAEWSLCPTNAAFLRVHTGVYDPALIGDKHKWYSNQLQPFHFKVWKEQSCLENALMKVPSVEEQSSEESASESDDADSVSSSYSSLSEFVKDMFNSEICGGVTGRSVEEPSYSEALLDQHTVYKPPSSLQLPVINDPATTDVELSLSESESSSSSDSSVSSPSFSCHAEADLEVATKQVKGRESQDIFPLRKTRGRSEEGSPLILSQEEISSSFTPSVSTSMSVLSPQPSITTCSSSGGTGNNVQISVTPEKDLSYPSKLGEFFSKPAKLQMESLWLTPDHLSDKASPRTPSPSRMINITSMLSRASSLGGSNNTQQSSQPSILGTMAKDVRDAAKEAGKVAVEASKSAIEATKPAREASKKSLLKNFQSFGEPVTKEKPKQGIEPQKLKDSGSGTFISTMSNELDALSSQTSSMISGWFGGQRGQSIRARERSQPFGPFPKGRKALVERTHLIKHSTNQQKRQQEMEHLQNVEAHTTTHSENQQFLNEIINGVFDGEGVGWLKLNRIKRLMEDENYRNQVVSALNKTVNRKTGPDDRIEDVCLPKAVWKGMIKLLLAVVSGLEYTYANNGLGGMASALQALEIAHTHYWAQDPTEEQHMDTSTTASASLSQCTFIQGSTPFGSGENLYRQCMESGKLDQTGELNHGTFCSEHGPCFLGSELSPHQHKDSSLSPEFHVNVTVSPESSELGETNDSLRTFIATKRNLLFSNMTSLEMEQASEGVTGGSDTAVASSNASESGSLTTNPTFCRTSLGDQNMYRSTASDSEVESGNFPVAREKRTPSVWSSKSSLSMGLQYHRGSIVSTSSNPDHEAVRRYLYEGLIGKERPSLWDKMQFWEYAFLDAVVQERDMVGMDQGPGELMEKYKSLSTMDQKRLEHEEDRLLSTLLYNLVAYMVMTNVNKNDIKRKVRRLLGKSHIGLIYSAEVNELLDHVDTLNGNDIDLKPLSSRHIFRRSFTVHSGMDASGEMLFIKVRDDGIVLRGVTGTVKKRWWYERLVNMTYSPKNKVLCLWRRDGGQTQLHKYYTKKCRDLYYCVKEAMERAAVRSGGVLPGTELGGEFPVQDMRTGEGGLLQVCMEGIGLLFANSKFFVRLENIRKCFTQKGGIFILEEFNRKTRQIIHRWYKSQMADQICYAVLCVFSYMAAGSEQRKHRLKAPVEIRRARTTPSSPVVWQRK
ncbi:MAP kinase-activating death domain protein-like isoform X2 [Limulus polyphemus]|uniref:MAP kinase-activating death domain protein n=1 Tax=Limulus polyphemus TaxID=6850 RepID=A0ABM1SPU7_LIMPO|nr:MAP kinase-activating death domain protein-like isoform X2 [Limulus polyphemus]